MRRWLRRRRIRRRIGSTGVGVEDAAECRQLRDERAEALRQRQAQDCGQEISLCVDRQIAGDCLGVLFVLRFGTLIPAYPNFTLTLVLTKEELKRELRKIGKRDPEIFPLLHPDRTPIKDFANIRITFTGFEDWFNAQWLPLKLSMRAAAQRYLIEQAEYRRVTGEQLAALAKRSETGRAVLAEIKGVSQLNLTIMPVASGENNAFADAMAVRKSTRLGFMVRGSNGRELSGWEPGTGEGSVARVEFTPSMWGPSGSSNATGPGLLPDEVLCHELVHAGRQMKGVTHSKGVTGGYENEEEYIAIIVTNIYLSEKKQTRLRGTHGMKEKKDAFGNVVGIESDVLPHPERFLDNPQGVNLPPAEMLEKIRIAQRSLYNALLDIKPPVAAFNPVRDWETKRAKVLIDL